MENTSKILSVASSITRVASKQTYYTIRFLADRGRVENAYRAYAYFRWVDDLLDADADKGPILINGKEFDQNAFLERQKRLLEESNDWRTPSDVNAQERMLVDLVQSNTSRSSGLQAYLRYMMLVMDFDVRRRGRLISQAELKDYTNWLAIAVTECLSYFIGNGIYAPRDEKRYLAVSAAHIAHMLRDTYIDTSLGYFNIPREVLETNHIGIKDLTSPAYRVWVKSRVQLARQYFEAGKEYFLGVPNTRLRLAVFAYIARFEWLLDTVEKEGFLLRPGYPDRKSIRAGLKMGWSVISTIMNSRAGGATIQPVISKRQGRVSTRDGSLNESAMDIDKGEWRNT